MKVLVVVDMQNDFVDAALGSPEAAAIVPAVCDKIKNFDGKIIFTRDTHEVDYLQTQEGRNLPVEHCIRGSEGWQLHPEVNTLTEGWEIIDKPGFGSPVLGEKLAELDKTEGLESITFIGLCTDICVIANVMVAKAFVKEVPLIVDAACCAGVTPESHINALAAMKMCQVAIEHE